VNDNDLYYADETFGLAKLHQQLHDGPGVAVIDPAVHSLARLGKAIDESSDRLSDALRAVGVNWRGEAATAAAGSIQQLAGWTGHGGQTTAAASTHVQTYSGSFAALIRAVPPPSTTPIPPLTEWDSFWDHLGNFSDHARAIQANRNAAAAAYEALGRHSETTTGAINDVPAIEPVPQVTTDSGPNPPGSGPPPQPHTHGSTPASVTPGGGRHPGSTHPATSTHPAPSTHPVTSTPPVHVTPSSPTTSNDTSTTRGTSTDTNTASYTTSSTTSSTDPTSDTLDPDIDPDTDEGSGRSHSSKNSAFVPPMLPPLPASHEYVPGRIQQALDPQPPPARTPGAAPNQAGASTAGLAETESAAAAKTGGSGGMPMGGMGGASGRGQEKQHRNNHFIPSDEPFNVEALIDADTVPAVLGEDGNLP
jgi:hypothetical protein